MAPPRRRDDRLGVPIERGLVYLFMKRYDGASAIDMSQEHVAALLSNRDEAYLS